jgi:hypothetical protein
LLLLRISVTVLGCSGIGAEREEQGLAARCRELTTLPPLCGSHSPVLARPPADLTVHFRVTLTEGKMREALATGLVEKFKLKSKISTGGWVNGAVCV